MKRIQILSVCVLNLILLSGCSSKAKTKSEIKEKDIIFRASDSIRNTYSYTIRKGETISFNLPEYYLDKNYDYLNFENYSFDCSDVIVENNTDGLIFEFNYPFCFISCEKEFNNPIVIDHLLLKEENSDKYIYIPVNLIINFNPEDYIEPPFPEGYKRTDDGIIVMNTQLVHPFNCSGFFTNEEYVNTVWFTILPRYKIMKNVRLEVDNIDFVNNDFCFVDKLEYTTYSVTSDNWDMISITDFDTYKDMDSSVFIDDSVYASGEYGYLIFKFTFSDTLNDESYLTGGTLKFDIKIDGDPYSVYRSLDYYRI